MILIAFGSSLPFCQLDSQQIVLKAVQAVGRFAQVVRCSSLYESPAWPDPGDPSFINAAAEIETGLAPEALMAALHAVEAGFGRRRERRNGPRTLDLDLLAYHDERREGGEDGESGLILPHPRIEGRGFVLAPLAEIAPEWRIPGSGRTAASLLGAADASAIRRI